MAETNFMHMNNTLRSNRRGDAGFTLIEILIVVVILAVLAAVTIPQFGSSTKDAKSSALEFDLSTLRSQIEVYRSQHDYQSPSGTLAELLVSSNAAGKVGTGAGYKYGPYLREIPVNPFTNSKAVKVVTNSPPLASDVSPNGGWLYHLNGGVWADHAEFYQK